MYGKTEKEKKLNILITEKNRDKIIAVACIVYYQIYVTS